MGGHQVLGVHLLAVGGEVAEVTLSQRGGLLFLLHGFELAAIICSAEEWILAGLRPRFLSLQSALGDELHLKRLPLIRAPHTVRVIRRLDQRHP